MLNKLLATGDDLAPFIARVVVGGVIFAHGAQKLLGWFGGKGWAETMEFFTAWGFPSFLVVLLILIESIGMLLLMAGFGGRIWAALLSLVMVVAVVKARHYQWFFMNWYAERRGEGFEYHLLVLALASIVLILGSGRWSIDRRLSAGRVSS
jgi:putative oxidoreductase